MIPELTPFPAESGGTSSPLTGAKSLGKDDFLKLLVAQLEAQDPLSPLEAQDFSAQLAQFSSLEQITNVNQNLEQIQKFEAALSNSSAVNLIGKSIDAPGNRIDYEAGKSTALNYSLDKEAAEVTIDIFDATGTKVTSLTVANQTAGNNQVIWSGLDGTGKQVESGAYTFQVSAEDLNGEAVLARTFIAGKVSDVIFEEGEAFAIVNGQKLAVNGISRVSL